MIHSQRNCLDEAESVIGLASDWLELDSPDDWIRHDCEIALKSELAYALYLLWALLPPRALEAIGLGWYPSREWAVLVPAYTVVLVLVTYAGYFALALAGTPSFDSLSTVTGMLPSSISCLDAI